MCPGPVHVNETSITVDEAFSGESRASLPVPEHIAEGLVQSVMDHHY